MRTVSEYMIMPHLMLGLTPLRCATLVVTPQRQRYAAAHGLQRQRQRPEEAPRREGEAPLL